MGAKSMDVFSLRDTVVGEYRKFATSFTTIHAEDIRAQVEAIYSKSRFWPDPLIQINPSYKRGLNLQTLISNGALDPRTADIFRADDGAPLSLYKHQEQAVILASQGESYVVTTGTGSGKSLCFFIPIVSAVLAEKRKSSARRTRAIIIYPMNALANSQLEELDKFVANVLGEKPVTFERYTGQEDSEKRRSVSKSNGFSGSRVNGTRRLEHAGTQVDELAGVGRRHFGMILSPFADEGKTGPRTRRGRASMQPRRRERLF